MRTETDTEPVAAADPSLSAVLGWVLLFCLPLVVALAAFAIFVLPSALAPLQRNVSLECASGPHVVGGSVKWSYWPPAWRCTQELRRGGSRTFLIHWSW